MLEVPAFQGRRKECELSGYPEKGFKKRRKMHSTPSVRKRVFSWTEIRKKIQEEFLRNFKISSETEMALSVNDQLLQTVFSHIEEHLHDDQFGVDKLSKLAGMSRKHLNNKIKSLTKQTTNELIRNFRLRKAAYLLSEKGISVSKTCYQVGFNNLSYFSKCFADFYGKRPSDYSKM